MRQLSSAVGSHLCWVQLRGPSGRRFELLEGSDVLATLRFESVFASTAIGSSADGSWGVKREGFLMPRVSVRKAGEGSTQATYEPNWLETKGTLRFRDGRVFIWKRARLWRNQCRFENLDGETLVVSTTNVERGKGGNVQNTEGLVIIDQHARTLDELSLLVVLDWYLTVCRLNNPAFAVCSS